MPHSKDTGTMWHSEIPVLLSCVWEAAPQTERSREAWELEPATAFVNELF